MAFGKIFREHLPRLEDDARALAGDVRDEVSAWWDRTRPERTESEDRAREASRDARDWLDARWDDLRAEAGREVPPVAAEAEDALRRALERSGLAEAGRDFDLGDVNSPDDLAAIVDRLPPELAGPDATGEVPTGSADLPRELVATAATLAAAARVVDALGPTSETMVARWQDFTIAETYRDPISGFLAVRLTPADGGAEIFSVDGLQVGSRADAVAAATLGRLQVGSDAFAAMVADAAAIAEAEDRPVLFTGPSLGGAVAQAAAYETAEALLASTERFDTGAVQLVTVDPLGGRDAAEWANGGTLDPAALELIAALNIRTEGDLVSRIGSHIGATRTLPALDAQGNPVVLDAGDAHVNTASLMQVLNSDALFASGTTGAPAEIGAFARASEAASDELIDLWRDFGTPEAPGRDLQIRGQSGFDATGTQWWVDLDENGTGDIVVGLSAPFGGTDALIA